ncbi:helix-turn-helix transcriptional regulator, partial [bacterium]|nr:helix-turn-helix transcriptional regulator [bacterium]
MREITFPESGPKRKLLDAAEQLFAERGFETVSVRDITQLAQTNVAAVNYHFGSRDALLTLVMMRCLTPVNDERTAMLETFVQNESGNAVLLEEILEALIRPLVAQASRSM